MRAPFIAAMSLLLAGCGSAPDEYRPNLDPIPNPMHTATVAAARDCGGPYVGWSRTTERSTFPYRETVTETMRCLKDGRIVGPYTYRTDGL